MTSGQAVRLVAAREITERIRQRSFLVSTGITVLLVLAVVIAGALLGDRRTSYDVGVVGGEQTVSGAAAGLLQRQAEAADVTVRLRPLPDDAAAVSAVRAEDVDVALVGGRLVVQRELPDRLQTLATAASQQATAVSTLTGAGVDPETVRLALSPAPPEIVRLEQADPDRDTRRGIAYAGTILLYAQLIGYGIVVANGVIEEKSSRVVEVLLAAIRPRQLLAGKLLGVGALALGQLLLIAGVGLGAGAALGAFSLPASVFGIVGQVFLWFLLGFALFACLYAAAASTVSRQEDLQNATTPLNFALIGSFFAAVYAFNAPGSAATTVLSFVPPFSALVMPVRSAGGDVAWWEVALAVVLMLVMIAALLRLAARVYEGAILRIGARVGWREALRVRPRETRS